MDFLAATPRYALYKNNLKMTQLTVDMVAAYVEYLKENGNPGSDDPLDQVELTPEAKISLTPLPKIKMTPVDVMSAGILYVSLVSVLADGG